MGFAKADTRGFGDGLGPVLTGRVREAHDQLVMDMSFTAAANLAAVLTTVNAIGGNRYTWGATFRMAP